MRRNYSRKTFVQDAPRELLRRYFEMEAPGFSCPWDEMEAQDVEPILEAWEALPEEVSQKIECTFQEIHDLASETGICLILSEADEVELDLRENLETQEGLVSKVFWVRLEHPDLFDQVQLFSETDHLDGRCWRKRKGLPQRIPDTSPTARERLTNALKSYYWQKEGRARKCEVQHYIRSGNRHYFYAYPEGYVTEFKTYTKDGKLVRRTLALVSEIVFVVEPSAGTLELFAKGDKKLKEDLAEIFCRSMFEEDLQPEDEDSTVYDLNVLKRPDHVFPTDPQDRIEEVSVRKLRFSVIGNEKHRLTVEIGGRKEDVSVYQLMEKFLDKEKLSLELVNITQANLRVKIDMGKPRRKSVTFTITHPDSCSLKDKPEHHLIRKYLPRWNLENGTRSTLAVANQ